MRTFLCLALLALTACTHSTAVEVMARHDLPATIAPQPVVITPAGDLREDSLRFAALHADLGQRLAAVGFPPAAEGGAAAATAEIAYTRPSGRITTRYRTRPSFLYGPRFAVAYTASGRPVFVQAYPWRRWVQEPVAVTLYDHVVALSLRDAAGAPLWEGEARVVTRSPLPESALDAGVAGLFADFPGPDGVLRVVTLQPPEGEETP